MISIIFPVYNEEENLKPLHLRLQEVMRNLERDYEVIYVDDGSTDNSLSVLRENVSKDNHTKIIKLTKNFGQTLAIQAGIDYSKGDILIIMDADLQNDPKDIPRLLRKIEEGYDVVSGWRKHRQDPLFTKKIPSYLANRLISFLTGIRLNDFGCSLKAYKRKVLKEIRLYGEMHRLIPLYAAMQGYSITEVEVSHKRREHGKSKYGLSRVFKLILDLFMAKFLISYATRPIYVFGGIGIVLSSLGVLIGIVVIIRKVFLGGVWISPLLFISLLFSLIGIQSILMGVLAEMIIRIYFKPRGVSTYVVKEVIENERR